ncbi:DNA adenine methylase [Kingella kingae]|uniref:Site-specific DNA-methyltransferase (adenine-specific) n=2 Tax=Kingella kingae TaxID=504 RepID=F5S657_KINKI|nr:Dam family site-specific DNA-(adenine-N6)-methyltransferase [Kingella kingae]EGK10536.1 DNA adenine methylase [Kingella kingae ATCC 23330]MDK4529288.1 Dam family site-specific DNA-(adenine-N6)-methyltransferase [Kingella kingae]MDK4533508.1 Dam family site-specific DNA-(adenine-N6)-methyltransferase [Kingella kingae]MDK4540010.1 Dam family site-specific DNA-(adenine-N6)-methyltransferase [Kingella kingae]MDK4552541.1 Dam family site-specific DNA-(adenine-N6)-methyltransferase [Kingella king
MSQFKRSPLFYVGDKYKLLNEIAPKFPQNIQRWIEPFVGGGSVFLNVQAQSYCLNDINSWVIQLHQFLCQQSENSEAFFQEAFDLIQQYGLSCTYLKNDIPDELKRLHKKTYIARYNKIAFEKLRDDFNRDQTDLLRFYVLLIYGFNRMIRFNQSGNYNLPVGNVDWNKNVVQALQNYFLFSDSLKNQIAWHNQDYEQFIETVQPNSRDFIYLDPPYLITFSEYNKLWQLDDERRLLNLLDDLNRQNIRFAISNVTHYKGRVNTLFETWAQQYHTHRINSNYISYHDNSNKEFTEILVCNYD